MGCCKVGMTEVKMTNDVTALELRYTLEKMREKYGEIKEIRIWKEEGVRCCKIVTSANWEIYDYDFNEVKK